MKVETIVHLDVEMDMGAKNELLDKICNESDAISKPDHQSEKAHALIMMIDETKMSIHDIPGILEKHGVKSEVVS